MKHTDVLIIGAGPAGSVAAALIKKAGFEVTVIEKTQFPRFVIGESLLPRCLDALEEAGFMPALQAKGFQEKSGAKFVLKDKLCDFTFKHQHTDGYQYAWQMPRADFDHTLTSECERMGVNIHFQSEVTAVEIDEAGNSLSTIVAADGSTFQVKARFLIDASGYGRVLPRLFGLEQAPGLPTRKTVFCHLKDPKRLEREEPNRIVIYAQDMDCWIWTIPFSNGNTSVGFVANPEYFDKFEGGDDLTLLYENLVANEPHLKDRFASMEMDFEPRSIQGWSASSTTFYGKGYALTGNVTEFLDPIFSSGVTLAAVSSQKAASLVIRELNGEKVDWQEEYMNYMERGVDVFRTYVEAWYTGELYKIFFADEKSEQMKGEICSVLAGYVWDETNPFVKNHKKALPALIKFLSRDREA